MAIRLGGMETKALVLAWIQGALEARSSSYQFAKVVVGSWSQVAAGSHGGRVFHKLEAAAKDSKGRKWLQACGKASPTKLTAVRR